MAPVRSKLAVEEFDKSFDDGEDMADFIDWSQARHLNRPTQTVGLDLPAWMVERLESEAVRMGVSTESLIKVWLAERLRR
ncbi:MAG: type II toxin-antitoxin system BrnA family antitoxin [Pseudomonadota bacterium]|jgi:hypothetical protein